MNNAVGHVFVHLAIGVPTDPFSPLEPDSATHSMLDDEVHRVISDSEVYVYNIYYLYIYIQVYCNRYMI